MHQLVRIAKEVDKTHPNLGNLVAVSTLCIKAKKFLLVVSPRGCGKSCSSYFMASQLEEVLTPERVTYAKLGEYAGEFSNFQGVLIIDDMSKCGTHYVLAHTASVLAELCYGHRIESAVKGATYRIENFHAAIIANIQPALLRFLMKDEKWETSMMDKSIRYYHLFRPIRTNRKSPEVKIDWGIDITQVKEPNLKGKLEGELLEIGAIEWGFTRLHEHMVDLIKAAAALDGRDTPNQSDFKILIKLLKPLKVERLVTDKVELEGATYLANNQLAILTEFVTHGEFTIKQLCSDYKLSIPKGYRIMNRFSDLWIPTDKTPTRYIPSDELREELKEVGLL